VRIFTAGFQSRRLNTRVRRANGKIEPVHMNDATVVSQRPLIAILGKLSGKGWHSKNSRSPEKVYGGQRIIK